MYNGLVALKNRSEEAWSDIDVQLKRRYNLIPNLVETVKGYATHEKSVFENVTKARGAAINASGVEDQTKAENMLSGALKSLFAVAENYPDLKASDNFAKLQDELTDTENKIEAARRFYNSNVRDLNIKIERFPENIVANSFNFKKRDLFELDLEEERKAVNVSF
jgi:LemA protein